MRNSILFIFIFFVQTSMLASEPGVLVLSGGEKIALDQLRLKSKPFERDWTRDCSVVDCKRVIKPRVKVPPIDWCPPTYCDPIDPTAIVNLIGEKAPHIRVKPDGFAALFIGDVQMTEPKVIKLPKLEPTSRDIRQLPILPTSLVHHIRRTCSIG